MKVCWMKVSLDESVNIGWKCFGWKCHWMKPFLDESVIGWNRVWMKVPVDEIDFGWKCILPTHPWETRTKRETQNTKIISTMSKEKEKKKNKTRTRGPEGQRPTGQRAEWLKGPKDQRGNGQRGKEAKRQRQERKKGTLRLQLGKSSNDFNSVCSSKHVSWFLSSVAKFVTIRMNLSGS